MQTNTHDVSSGTSHLFQALLLLFDLMLVRGHLQKVLFAADEAHCASHPSEASAHTSKSIHKVTPAGLPPSRSPPQRSSDGFIPLTQATNVSGLSCIAASCCAGTKN